MKYLISILFIFSTFGAICQEFYIRTFGDPKDQAVVFLHGGPGYNSATFEVTTAGKLADKGYYVVVYDRSGEGRSVNSEAKYTFKEAFSDLLQIMDSLKIEKPQLIGHSFGGMIGTYFATKYPDKVGSLFLVSTPVNLQSTFKHIIAECEAIYRKNKDETNLSYIQMLKEMDTTSIYYSSYCFMHAMQNGFYSARDPSPEARQNYSLFSTDPILIAYAKKMGQKAPLGYLRSENYTSLDISDHLTDVMNKGVPVFGLYGKEDGLYSQNQIIHLKSLLGEDNFLYLDNCSHSVFIDRQETFVNAIDKWAN